MKHKQLNVPEARVIDHYAEALASLHEFVTDVETVGRKTVGREWPDLSITFNKAERLLIRIGTGEVNPLRKLKGFDPSK